MGKKADRIAALEALLATAERERDEARRERDRLRVQLSRLDRPGPSWSDRVRDEVADRVSWLRDAMGLGL